MRYLALCCDYDGTLATDGIVFPETVAALERLIASGRRPVLVTGRELNELQTVCPYLDLFEYVVAENGALLYIPATGAEVPLGGRPPDSFIAALRARGVGPISVGRVIVATWEPHETAVLEAIKEEGLDLQVIFNKGAVMILPASVNKATGLAAALERMGLSRHNAVGIGDAENDHALLSLCECGVAVSNALPTVKERADFVTTADHGAGVVELISALLADDLASHEPELTRHHISLGLDTAGQEVRVRPYGENVLLMGAPGTGRSTLAAHLLEQLSAQGYSCCVIDADGQYEGLRAMVSLGTADRPPSVDEICKLFRDPGESGIVNLAGIPVSEHARFLQALLPGLAKLRVRHGRPHWLAVDTGRSGRMGKRCEIRLSGHEGTPAALPGLLQIAEHPGVLARADLGAVNFVIATGDSPQQKLEEYCHVTAMPAPCPEPLHLEPGEVLAWRPRSRGSVPFRLRLARDPAS